MNGYHLFFSFILLIFVGRIILFMLNATIELYLLKEKLGEEKIRWLLGTKQSAVRSMKNDFGVAYHTLKLLQTYLGVQILKLRLQIRDLAKLDINIQIIEKYTSLVKEKLSLLSKSNQEK